MRKWDKTEKGKAYHKQYHKDWYAKNKERIKEGHKDYGKMWREKNSEKIAAWLMNNRQKIRDQSRIYAVLKRKNPRYRIDASMASMIWQSLKGIKAGRKWEALVGYTLKDLIEHLEKRFTDKMSWKNYGPYWHVDHIKPRILFSYVFPEDKEFKECWALNNLQPLEGIANIKKGSKY